VFFVKNRYGALELCIGYRQRNRLTIENKYPLPRIDYLFDQIKGAAMFFNINLRSRYHWVRIKEHDIFKTMFRNKYGNYEFFLFHLV